MASTTPGHLRSAARLLGPILLVFVVWKAGVADLLAVVERADLGLLGLAIVLNGVPLHLKVVRWRWLLREQGHEYPLGQCYVAVLSSLYLGMVTPGRVGDVLRVQYVRNDIGVSYSEGLAATVMDRFCDLYVLAGFAAAGIAHFAALLPGHLTTVGWVTVGLATASPLVFLVPGLAEPTLERLYRRFASVDHRDGAGRFLASLRALVRLRLGYAVALSVVAFLVNYLQGWLIAGAIDAGIGFHDVVGMLAVTSLLGLMPISISGVGLRELFLALIFPALGSTGDVGVAFGLLVFAGIYLPFVVAGFVVWQLVPPPFGAAPPRT